MDQRFERITNTQRALWLLRKFETLNLPNIGIQDKYHRILSHYSKDLEMVSKQYQKNKSDPPVARDLPPIAGKIAWARQLFRRIQEPIEAFQQHSNILQSPEARKIIKNFNKVAKVLLEFEMLYHRGWLRQVEYFRQICIDNKTFKYLQVACHFLNINHVLLFINQPSWHAIIRMS